MAEKAEKRRPLGALIIATKPKDEEEVEGPEVDPGKVAAIEAFEAAATTEEKAEALSDFVRICMAKKSEEGDY